MIDEMKSAPVGVEGLSASLRDARERMIAALGSRFGEAFDGDFDVMRDAADALAQQPAAVALSREELDTCRQWFDSVQDTNGGYLTPDDYVLAEKLYRSVGMRVPDSIGRVATQQGGRR